MYSLLNLYKQLPNLHVQMDAAAKPKVFFFFIRSTKFESENRFKSRIWHSSLLMINTAQHPVLLNKVTGKVTFSK